MKNAACHFPHLIILHFFLEMVCNITQFHATFGNITQFYAISRKEKGTLLDALACFLFRFPEFHCSFKLNAVSF